MPLGYIHSQVDISFPKVINGLSNNISRIEEKYRCRLQYTVWTNGRHMISDIWRAYRNTEFLPELEELCFTIELEVNCMDVSFVSCEIFHDETWATCSAAAQSGTSVSCSLSSPLSSWSALFWPVSISASLLLHPRLQFTTPSLHSTATLPLHSFSMLQLSRLPRSAFVSSGASKPSRCGPLSHSSGFKF